jgi:hypothetical protein
MSLTVIFSENNFLQEGRGVVYSLNHVQDGLVLVQPHIMIRNCHCLKRYRLRILEEGVWPPHILQPIYFK